MIENMLVMNKRSFLNAVCIAVSLAAVTTSCRDDKSITRSTGWEFSPNMYNPIGYNPDQPNSNFQNGSTAQVPPAETLPIGFFDFAGEFPNGPEGYEKAGQDLKNPLEATKENLAEGEHLFLVNCAICHGKEGKGDGPITKDRTVTDSRGTRQLENFPPPPSFARSSGSNSSRGGAMADLSAGKIYHTIYYGLNGMGSYASQIDNDERWKVIMYVQELQKK